MTQLSRTHFLPHLCRRLAPGQIIQKHRGRDLVRMRLLTVSLCTAFLVLFSASNAPGQVVTGTLTGTVTDATGATIPNAKVTITQVSTGVQRSATTSADGLYNFPYLAPDDYRVEVSASGFKSFTQSDITVSVSTVARLNAVLTPGNASETVTVTAAPPPLQTESVEVAVNLAARQVTDVPLQARNVQGLAGLAAGVTPPQQSFTQVEDPQRTTFFNANGQDNSANNTIVDGVDNTDPLLGLSIYLPAPELVQEVHVSTSNYSAEFGRVAGAVVNEATRTGTNQFHGSLWEYNKVAALEAKNYFGGSLSKPPLTFNDFGGAVGGPIIKNNTFFFGAYHGVRQRSSSTSTGTVPLPAFLNGDFSSVPGIALYNPFTGNPDGTGRVPFVNNIIPQNLISGPAAAINKFFPAPNLPGITNNWVTNIPFSYNADNYTARIDHTFTEQTKIFGETNISRYTTLSPTFYPEPLGNGVNADDDTYTGILNFTHGFGPGLLTELRLAYNLYATNVVDTDKTLDNAQAGIADPNPYPISTGGIGLHVYRHDGHQHDWDVGHQRRRKSVLPAQESRQPVSGREHLEQGGPQPIAEVGRRSPQESYGPQTATRAQRGPARRILFSARDDATQWGTWAGNIRVVCEFLCVVPAGYAAGDEPYLYDSDTDQSANAGRAFLPGYLSRNSKAGA